MYMLKIGFKGLDLKWVRAPDTNTIRFFCRRSEATTSNSYKTLVPIFVGTEPLCAEISVSIPEN